MRMRAFIAGVGMTHFGKHLELGLKSLGAEAVKQAVADAGVELHELQAAWVGNAAAGLMTGQESIRGQVILRSIGLGRIPVVNVENACASASTALYEACAMVSAGLHDVVLAVGVEKLYDGLLRKGHPVGATGIAQIVELAEQLQGRSGGRQVEGASVALAQNGGGSIGRDAAAMCVTILAA